MKLRGLLYWFAPVVVTIAGCDRTVTYDVHHVQSFFPAADENTQAVLAIQRGEYIETVSCFFPPMPDHLHLEFHRDDDPEAREVVNELIRRVEVGERNEQYLSENYYCKIVDV